MAPKQKNRGNASVPSKNKFAESMFKISQRFSLHNVFDDFLSMSMAAVTQNPETMKSWYEEEYLAAIAKYKDFELRYEFPNAFAHLVNEMENRFHDSSGNDILGEFFEQNISHGRNGQFFTPYPVCHFMATSTRKATVKENGDDIGRTLRILDPACGSGRMLLASHKVNGPGHEYYGIDIDRTCVKMTALNLFLNSIWYSEVMCADALLPNDFVISYHISFAPLGIFKIEEKEKSRLWHLVQQSLTKEKTSDNIALDSTPFNERSKDNSSQLNLF